VPAVSAVQHSFVLCELFCQIGTFVADVTSVLAEEESEAMKRYTRSAQGKSFSRKTSRVTLPLAKTASVASSTGVPPPSERPSQPDVLPV